MQDVVIGMKLIAISKPTGVKPLENARTQSSTARQLVVVHQEARRDYAAVLAEQTGVPARGSLVDLLA